jgi:hypothetical protein
LALALILQAQVMLVKVKHPNQKEHQQQACQTAAHRDSLLNQRDGVGQQMKQRNPQHHPRNQTQSHLNSAMRKSHQARKRSAKSRRQRDEDAVNN